MWQMAGRVSSISPGVQAGQIHQTVFLKCRETLAGMIREFVYISCIHNLLSSLFLPCCITPKSAQASASLQQHQGQAPAPGASLVSLMSRAGY